MFTLAGSGAQPFTLTAGRPSWPLEGGRTGLLEPFWNRRAALRGWRESRGGAERNV